MRMPGKPVILCVDDNEDSLRTRSTFLQVFGCTTLTAPDHDSALRTIAEEHVDLLIIDYHLANGETGEVLARDIRATRPDLPLIMLSGDMNLPPSVYSCVDKVFIKGHSNPQTLLEEIEGLLPGVKLRPGRAGGEGGGKSKAS